MATTWEGAADTLAVWLAGCPPACLPGCLPARLPACLPASPPARPPACLPARLPGRLAAWLPTKPPGCLAVWLDLSGLIEPRSTGEPCSTLTEYGLSRSRPPHRPKESTLAAEGRRRRAVRRAQRCHSRGARGRRQPGTAGIGVPQTMLLKAGSHEKQNELPRLSNFARRSTGH